jgi:hypothetical protein
VARQPRSSIGRSSRRYPFRIFISYSREDLRLAQKVVRAFEGMGLTPLWDPHVRPGMPFTDEIKGLITHAHLFMPLITKHSQTRPWVHQETGYAMALNVPVLPLSVGRLPGEMIEQLQAVTVRADLRDLRARLRAVDLAQTVSPLPVKPERMTEVADVPERRAKLLARYAGRVEELGFRGHVRQRGAFSTFCVPDKEVGGKVWDDREGNTRRTPYFRQLQREERQALERHARSSGCTLIIDPTMKFDDDKGEGVTRTRLTTLLEFLESMPDDRIKVAFSPQAHEGNLTIVGDWFVADSMVPGPMGYRQTIFDWHAPSVLGRLRKFDLDFSELALADPKGGSSRRAAIAKIRDIVRALPQAPLDASP